MNACNSKHGIYEENWKEKKIVREIYSELRMLMFSSVSVEDLTSFRSSAAKKELIL